MDGAIDLLKPPGMTSSDAVVWLRHRLGIKKIGHGGTLDPAAAGVLPILIGRGTRLFDMMLAHKKTYVATIAFGVSTDTLDAEGEVTARTDSIPTEADIVKVLPDFIGRIEQLPPKYSAIKIGGRHAYDIARTGAEIEMQKRSVEIYSIRSFGFTGERELRLEISCSSGTYIRTLAQDIAESAGSLAHLSALVRTRSGGFRIEDAMTVEDIQSFENACEIERAIIQPNELLSEFQALSVRENAMKRAVNGAVLSFDDVEWDGAEGTRRLVTPEGRIISLCDVAESKITQNVMLFDS